MHDLYGATAQGILQLSHRTTLIVSACLFAVLQAVPSRAQEPPPPVPLLVVDLFGATSQYPMSTAVAESRGLSSQELPGTSFGGEIAFHVSLHRWRLVTLGTTVRAVFLRGRATDSDPSIGAVTERFASATPEVSLNFNGRNGWSYVSAGAGVTVWQITPDNLDKFSLAQIEDQSTADQERHTTLDFGAGAKWFAKRHIGFTFDVRVYKVMVGAASVSFPGSPRATFLLIGVGGSFK